MPKPSGEEVCARLIGVDDLFLTYKQDDPIIEYEDEFGRARTGRRSEIPRHLLENEEAAEEDIE